jgi:hypothetical protein
MGRGGDTGTADTRGQELGEIEDDRLRQRKIVMKSKQAKITKYVRIRAEMMDSPTFRTLSFSARRILNRIEIELCRKNGGKDNGKLTVTYNNFKQYGIHHHAIGPAIREAVALGFIKITRQGRAGNADHRISNQFRLTYLPTEENKDPTDDWRHIDSKQIKALAREARREKPDGYPRGPQRRRRRRKSPMPSDGIGEPKSPMPVNAETNAVDRHWESAISMPGDGTEEPDFPMPDTGTTL